uniref:Secreted protein n=1 Tax=Opuntia streptacantha TaxID=393608 RepID=A0A7C8YP39_OPUST
MCVEFFSMWGKYLFWTVFFLILEGQFRNSPPTPSSPSPDAALPLLSRLCLSFASPRTVQRRLHVRRLRYALSPVSNHPHRPLCLCPSCISTGAEPPRQLSYVSDEGKCT